MKASEIIKSTPLLKAGQVHAIKNTGADGEPFIEGKAKLIKLINADIDSEYWTVQFQSDGFKCERWIPVDYNPTAEESRTRIEKGWHP